MRCYTRDELKSFVLGNLSEEILCQISDHLDSCDVCEDTIVGMDQTSDSLVESLKAVKPKGSGHVSPYDQNPDFELAVAAAHQQMHRQNAKPGPRPISVLARTHASCPSVFDRTEPTQASRPLAGINGKTRNQ